MEENKEEKFSINTEELKSETFETAKKIKETVKGTDIKEETKTTKNVIVEMFRNPLEKIKEIATDTSDKFLKTALILIILWTIIVFISSTYRTIYLFGFYRIFENILSVLKNILAPILGILVYSLIVLILNKENKKSLINTISIITLTQLPLIISALVSLLTIIESNISIITSPFGKICAIASIILGYFGLKYLFGEEDDKTFIRKYILIQVIYYVAYIVIQVLGIYI